MKKILLLIWSIIVLSIYCTNVTYANVKCLQSKLNLLGYNAGRVDGLLGKKTEMAAKKFVKLKNTSIVLPTKENSQQWCALLKVETEGLKVFDITSRPRKRLSTSEQNSLWTAYQNINQCFDHPTYGRGHSLKISQFTKADFFNQSWKSPFQKTKSTGQKYCTTKNIINGWGHIKYRWKHRCKDPKIDHVWIQELYCDYNRSQTWNNNLLRQIVNKLALL